MARPKKLEPLRKRIEPDFADVFDMTGATSDEGLIGFFGSMEKAREIWEVVRAEVIASARELALADGLPVECRLPWVFWRFEAPQHLGRWRVLHSTKTELTKAMEEKDASRIRCEVCNASAAYHRSAGRIEQAGEQQCEADAAAEIAKGAELRIAVLRKKIEMTARKIRENCGVNQIINEE